MQATPPLRVLLVEDDIDIAAGLGDYLARHGVCVDYAYNAAQADARVLDGTFDLLLLDVNLPGEDGLQLCRRLKHETALATPVLFMTARGGLDDKLQGFDAGAVDYVVKPFAPAELLARVRAICTHVQTQGGARIAVGGFVLDLDARLLSHRGRHLQLHAVGFGLLKALMQAHPRSVSHQTLCERIWHDATPESEPLRAHVHTLRRALQQCFGDSPIRTVRGVGYRFDADGTGPRDVPA